MYLVEIKIGNTKIRKYVANSKELGELIQQNMKNYEYIKILKELKEIPKVKKKTKNNN